MALIDVQQLAVAGRLQALDLSVQPGELLGVIGPNGAGKSTLLSCLAGVQRHTAEVRFAGQALATLATAERARRIGYLPQSQHSAWQLSVEEVVSLGRLPWRDEKASAIEHALAACELTALRKRPVAKLSGGQQARVWLARVLAGEPQLLLADEPLASLDLLHQRQVLTLLREQACDERAVVLSLHDLSLAARYCDRVALLAGGRLLAWGTPAEVLTEALLEQAFGLPVHVDLNAQPPLIQAY